MYRDGKESGDYLAQIKNNIEEKTTIIEDEVVNGTLPVDVNGQYNIVEMGTGGGDSLRKINNSFANRPDVKIIAIDILPGLASTLKREVGVEAIAADVCHLPLQDESVSGINASAILHEVSSYGAMTPDQKERVFGQSAVKLAIAEMNRVLLPEGKVAYRDVSAPQANMFKLKTVHYHVPAWKSFAEWFLPDFQQSQANPYKNMAELNNSENGLSINAPAGLQREFQRHYIMLRDYMRNVKSKEFGVTLLRSDWINETEGLKIITFNIDPDLAHSVDLSHFEEHSSSTETVYRGDSDKFDELYDVLLERYMVEAKPEFLSIIHEWQEREGSEFYLYGNMTDMIEMSIKSALESASTTVLLPKDENSVSIAPRYYYNRYLRDVIDIPEYDGKQMMVLTKLQKGEAIQALNNLIEHCPVSLELERLNEIKNS